MFWPLNGILHRGKCNPEIKWKGIFPFCLRISSEILGKSVLNAPEALCVLSNLWNSGNNSN